MYSTYQQSNSHTHAYARICAFVSRRLPESLLTTPLVPEFLVAAEAKNPGEIKSLLSSLPPANRIILDRLLQVCEKIVANEETTRMTSKDLGSTSPIAFIPRKNAK